MKKDLTNIQMLLNPRGIHRALFWFVDNVRQGALGGKYGGKTHKTSIIPAKLEALAGKKCQSKPLKLALISGQSRFLRASLNTFAPPCRFVPLSDQTFLGQPRTATNARKAFMKAAVVIEVTTSTLINLVTRSDTTITQHF